MASTHATAVRKLLPLLLLVALLNLCGCRTRRPDPGTVVVAIESSPNNLDPRVGTDAQSQKISALIFDSLVVKGKDYRFLPWLAVSWEQPDPLTWIFHLRDGVRFQDGRPLEAEDVAWTIDSMVDGTLVTAKSGNLLSVKRAFARDRLTVAVLLKRPDESLLFNLSDLLFGVVPRGSGRNFGDHPVGSGAFRFMSQAVDKEVVLERVKCWSDGLDGAEGNVRRLRFEVVPDAVTTALELKKGSADVAVNALTLDMVRVLRKTPEIVDSSGPGAPVMYLNFNVTAGPLRDPRVRQAIALAMDRQAIVNALWLGQARLAGTLLPPGHWAQAPAEMLASYPHDPARAAALLEAAGYRAGRDGVRVRLEMKTSNSEETGLLAQILQQQLAASGISLTIRASEFGTFYADVQRGAFQMYALRWIGSNDDPDILRYAFGSGEMPPVGGNRGRYSNGEVDSLLAEAAGTADERKRRADYVRVQEILSEDLPAIPLWYPDNHVVHRASVTGVNEGADGDFGFLRRVTVR